MKEILEKLYYNMENLIDDWVDMPETRIVWWQMRNRDSSEDSAMRYRY